MNLFNKIINSRTISLTTYKKSGKEIHTPVWAIIDNDVGYVRTSKSSGKVKRIKHNHDVIIASCTSSGRIIGNKLSANAEVLKLSMHDYQKISQKFQSKYSIIYVVITFFRRINYKNSVIIKLKSK